MSQVTDVVKRSISAPPTPRANDSAPISITPRIDSTQGPAPITPA